MERGIKAAALSVFAGLEDKSRHPQPQSWMQKPNSVECARAS
jgi:hypothetical protein